MFSFIHKTVLNFVFVFGGTLLALVSEITLEGAQVTIGVPEKDSGSSTLTAILFLQWYFQNFLNQLTTFRI